MPFSRLISITIGASDQPEKAVRHIGDLAVSRHNSERAARFDRHAPHMGAPAGQALGDHCPHQISCLIPEEAFVTPAMADREAQFVDVAHLSLIHI